MPASKPTSLTVNLAPDAIAILHRLRGELDESEFLNTVLRAIAGGRISPPPAGLSSAPAQADGQAAPQREPLI